MTEIFVKSLPLKDVISSLADAFGTTFIQKCHEYRLEIPQAYGSGFIRATNFQSGFGLLEYYCTFKSQIIIHFSVNKVHPLKFIYCSEGEIHHRFEESDKSLLIDQFKNVIVASTAHNGHVLKFPANKQTHINSLEISRKEFKAKIDCDLNQVNVTLRKLFKDLNAKRLFYYQGQYSLSMANCIENIQNSKLEGFTRRLFLEGKSNEILSIQIKDYEDDLKAEPKRQILRKSEMIQVEYAAKLLKQNLSSPFTVVELAKEVGTNPNKLQEGFRYTFGQTVNSYLNKLRLDYARDQLMMGTLNVSEITEHIGISNKSYFSRLFKSAYQINPKDFSKRIAKNVAKSAKNDPIEDNNSLKD